MTYATNNPFRRRGGMLASLVLIGLLALPAVSSAELVIEGSYYQGDNAIVGRLVVAFDDLTIQHTMTGPKGDFSIPNTFSGTVTLQIDGPHGLQTCPNLAPGKHQEVNLILDDAPRSHAADLAQFVTTVGKMDPQKVPAVLKKVIIDGDILKHTNSGILIDKTLPEKAKGDLIGTVKDDWGHLTTQLGKE